MPSITPATVWPRGVGIAASEVQRPTWGSVLDEQAPRIRTEASGRQRMVSRPDLVGIRGRNGRSTRKTAESSAFGMTRPPPLLVLRATCRLTDRAYAAAP